MNDPRIKEAFIPRAVRPHEIMDDEIDLRELFAIVWAGKWLIILAALLCGAVAGAYALSKPNIYRSEALLAAVSGESGGNLSRLAGQFGGLASMAGIDLGGGGSTDKKTVALEVLKSRAFITQFIRDHQLEVPLLATTGWDFQNQQWLTDTEIYDTATATWKADKDGKPGTPTDWDLFKAFNGSVLKVSEDKNSGMVRVAAETQSPEASREWVQLLVSDLNEHMRQGDIADATQSVNYLTAQLESTNVTEMQHIFFQLIEQQTRTIMLAKVRQEYVFKTIDPAVIPQEKTGPKRALMVVVGMMLGGMLGLFVVFGRQFLRGKE